MSEFHQLSTQKLNDLQQSYECQLLNKEGYLEQGFYQKT